MSFEYAIKALNHHNYLNLRFQVCQLNSDILLRINLLYTNKLYQYLVNGLSNSIMYLFFLIQNLLLLIFWKDDLEYMAL